MKTLLLSICLIALALAAAMLLTSSLRSGASANATTEVAVTLNEFHLIPDPSTAAVGDVQFNASNQGVLAHEVVVIKTDLAPGALPKKSDLDKVDEDAAGLQTIGEIEDTELGPGQSASATMNLEAGNYVLICNIVGHYTAGMYAAFSVGAAATPTPTATATATATPTATATATPTSTPSPARTATPTPTATVAALPAGGSAPHTGGLSWPWIALGAGAILAAGIAWRRLSSS